MQDPVQSIPMPARVKSLKLAPGKTTPREVMVCENDESHTVIFDAWAQWDLHLQDHIFVEEFGDEKCDDCGDDLTESTFHVCNAVALEGAREALIREHDALQRMISQPAPAHAASRTGAGPARQAWRREVCGNCGTENALIDAYAEHNPVLNIDEITTTFDKGHSCSRCQKENSPREILLSSHEAMQLASEIRDRAAALAAELVQIDNWISIHGTEYGISPERARDLAAAPGQLEAVKPS